MVIPIVSDVPWRGGLAECARRSRSSEPGRPGLSSRTCWRGTASSPSCSKSRDRDYVERRIRAGVLEQGTVDLLHQLGLDERLRREGMVHRGIELRFDGERHRIPLSELTGGRAITVYGQQEVVKDLIQARLAAGGQILFEAEAIGIERVTAARPEVRFRQDGGSRRWTATSWRVAMARTASAARPFPPTLLTRLPKGVSSRLARRTGGGRAVDRGD